jgi:glutamyl-tRNA reductase
MSVLVVGLSHRTAPIDVLEQAALSAEQARQLAVRLCGGDHVAEAVCLATCNRLEVYAEVGKFHGGVGEIGAALAEATGLALEDLTEHLYAHYESAAVAHLFSVTAGLDSMAVGEAQILGQVRSALRAGQQSRSAGRAIGHLLQQALRVGKRAHSETGLDRAAPSLVEAGLEQARDRLDAEAGALDVLVLGAGAMSGLAVATAGRAGVASVTVASRTFDRAQRLADSVSGRAVPFVDLPAALAGADVVIAAAGASGYLIGPEQAAAAQAARAGRAQVFVDLAMPRDVHPAAADRPGVHVIDLEHLGRELNRLGLTADVAAARALVADEVTAYLGELRAQAVAPTVVALRSMARSVVDAELGRLDHRLEGLDPAVRAEVEQTVHRVVEKLLHAPTVRIKELAAEPGGSSYAEALRTLFNLGTEPDGSDLSIGVDVGEPGIEIAMSSTVAGTVRPLGGER